MVYIVNKSIRLVLYELGPQQVLRDNSYRSLPLRNKSSLLKINVKAEFRGPDDACSNTGSFHSFSANNVPSASAFDAASQHFFSFPQKRKGGLSKQLISLQWSNYQPIDETKLSTTDAASQFL